MKKILIFGKFGQIAWELQKYCAELGEVHSVCRSQANFLDNNSLVNAIASYMPTHILNAAGYTDVDVAEKCEDIAKQINAEAVGVIFAEAKKINAKLIHYSTDFVFDGKSDVAYVESDAPKPLNVYGRSKLLGEKYLAELGGEYIILRTSWVYGSRGRNFYTKVLREGLNKEEIKVVGDQYGSPTWCRDLALSTAHILEKASFQRDSGIYHLSARGAVSRYDFATSIFAAHKALGRMAEGRYANVQSVSSSFFENQTPRPANSVLNSEKAFKQWGVQLPFWNDSLSNVVSESNLKDFL